ncbi:poly-gamma-glutamate hydrolase family protein [Staphylococcus petrasii]|uniref:poly-gamma-glutamate hydrolase family protein n=1 Tax=Staphylococcus petrasii TaxID=1276936 RepID=UPI001F56FBF6|nr:poly-gamma-glutamate hydrolase family protein [Staphylococcus petrasii]MCI2774223.1 poly-gamma-glutamate hydrolase family protein [Staphylococcus petrasii]
MKNRIFNDTLMRKKWLLGAATIAIGITTFSTMNGQAQAEEIKTPQSVVTEDNQNLNNGINNNVMSSNSDSIQDNKINQVTLTSMNVNTPSSNEVSSNIKPNSTTVGMSVTTSTPTQTVTQKKSSVVTKPLSTKASTVKTTIAKSNNVGKTTKTQSTKPSQTTSVSKAVKTTSKNTVSVTGKKVTTKKKTVKPMTIQVKKGVVKPIKKTYVASKTTTKTPSKKTKSTKSVAKKTNINSRVKPTTSKAITPQVKIAPKVKQTVTKVPSKTTSATKKTTNVATSKELTKVTPRTYYVGKYNPKDTYRSMTDLFAHTIEGKDWYKERSNKNSRVLILAPHGGNLEKGTTELAKAIANKGGYDYYAVNANRNANNRPLHVISTNYDDKDLINSNYNRDVSVSVHGAGQTQGYNTVLMGGRDTQLLGLISQELKKFKFNVQRATGYLAGTDTNNIVNFNKKGMGVQLEITPDIRKSFFKNGNDTSVARKVVTNWTSKMDNFATAVSNAIKKYKF